MRNLFRGDSSATGNSQQRQAADSMINMFGGSGSAPSPLSTSRSLAAGGGYGRQQQYQHQQPHQQQHQQQYHQHQHHSHQHQQQRPASPDPDYFVKKLLNDDGMHRTARDVVAATMTHGAASRSTPGEASAANTHRASIPLPTTKPKPKRKYTKKTLPKSKASSGSSLPTSTPAAAAAVNTTTTNVANSTENSKDKASGNSKEKADGTATNGDGSGDMPPIAEHFLAIVKFQMDIWGQNQPQLFQSICTLINTTFPFMAPLRFKTIHYIIGQIREKNPWLSQSLVLYYFPPSPATAPKTNENNMMTGTYPGEEKEAEEQKEVEGGPKTAASKDDSGNKTPQPQKKKRGRRRKNAPQGDDKVNDPKTPPATATSEPAVNPDTPKTQGQEGADKAAIRSPNLLLKEEPANDKLKSGELIPDGWIKRTFRRTAGNSAGTCDTYWISPVLHKKLRSLNEVSKFLFYLNETGNNDEATAWKNFRAATIGSKKKPPPEGGTAPPKKKSKSDKSSGGGGVAAAAAAAAAVVAAAYGGVGFANQQDGIDGSGEMII